MFFLDVLFWGINIKVNLGENDSFMLLSLGLPFHFFFCVRFLFFFKYRLLGHKAGNLIEYLELGQAKRLRGTGKEPTDSKDKLRIVRFVLLDHRSSHTPSESASPNPEMGRQILFLNCSSNNYE